MSELTEDDIPEYIDNNKMQTLDDVRARVLEIHSIEMQRFVNGTSKKPPSIAIIKEIRDDIKEDRLKSIRIIKILKKTSYWEEIKELIKNV